MNYEQDNTEQTTDELWEQSQADAATADVDDDAPESFESATVETEAQGTDDETPTDDDNPPAFDKEALFQEFSQRFAQSVLPSVQQQWLNEAMNRTRQSMKARDEQIKAQLAPVLELLQQQQAMGYVTAEDATAQYREMYQKVAQQQEQREEQAQKAAAYQQFLAQSQTPAYVKPEWANNYEALMQEVLDNSTLEDGDPELAKIPLTISDPDPNRAFQLFEKWVKTAETNKQNRLAKERPRHPKSQGFVDMGTGGGAGATNPLAGIEDTDQLWQLATGG